MHNFELLFDRHILYEDVYITRFQYEVSLPSPLPVSKIGLTTAILQTRRVCKLGLTTPILQNRTSLQTRYRFRKVVRVCKLGLTYTGILPVQVIPVLYTRCYTRTSTSATYTTRSSAVQVYK